MTRTTTTSRGRRGLNTAARVGGLLVASSLMSGAALAKDERKSKAAIDQKSTVAVKTAPGSRAAVKQAPAAAVPVKTIRSNKARQP